MFHAISNPIKIYNISPDLSEINHFSINYILHKKVDYSNAGLSDFTHFPLKSINVISSNLYHKWKINKAHVPTARRRESSFSNYFHSSLGDYWDLISENHSAAGINDSLSEMYISLCTYTQNFLKRFFHRKSYSVIVVEGKRIRTTGKKASYL